MSLQKDDYTFRWDIYSKLPTEAKFEAGFYQGFLSVYSWQVTFQVLYPQYSSCKHFSFTLQCLQSPIGGPLISSVRVLIFLDTKCISNVPKRFHVFDIDNEHKYSVSVETDIPRELPEHHFVILVYLSDSPKENYISRPEHASSLSRLSRDMKRLLEGAIGADMRLKTKDAKRHIKVHSYILDVRFKKFFEFYKIDKENEYKVNISSHVLWAIITCVYTGKAWQDWQAWENEACCTELCYAIDKFQLHGIYKYLLKSDNRQKRVTRNNACHETYLFPLEIVKGRPTNNFLSSKIFDSHPHLKLNFDFRVESRTGNWISFSLHSMSDIGVYAKVNLELVKKVNGEEYEVILFHEATFSLGPKGTEDSGPILFLGCPETFGDSDRAETDFVIRCVLHIGSPIMVQQVLSRDRPEHPITNLDLRHLLSNHMNVVRSRSKAPTIKVCSNGSSGQVISCSVHEGILRARLPRWWEKIRREGIEPVPEIVLCNLEIGALDPVIGYIYTGLISEGYFYDDRQRLNIKNFAEEFGFSGLLHEITSWEEKKSAKSCVRRSSVSS